MKKILNQAKQISPKWLNSPVKEQRPVSFKGFLPVLLKLPLEGFNFDKKILKKGKIFFCFPQRTITLSVMMLSGSTYKQLWYLHHCFYYNFMRYWLRELSRQAVFLSNQVLLLVHAARRRLQKVQLAQVFWEERIRGLIFRWWPWRFPLPLYIGWAFMVYWSIQQLLRICTWIAK